ncbi:DUF4337 family protein [Sulfuriferula nivalis]|uniref:Uncharacterized protein n=1 Tax=Sulfuriferula nivalis TaxID=2675298 RepID=A0A809S1U9_9PROT|nr:DUF4337 family protein [Sulfuriferula nivalis]BBP00578.1 hypothetical protein SFSGTM_12860 [Sulfuriferula nivalis]
MAFLAVPLTLKIIETEKIWTLFDNHAALNGEKKMAEDIKEPWLNYLALTTVIFAVCATLATFKGGGFSTRSVLSQTQASDQWAFYQAKAIKSYLYQMQGKRPAQPLQSLHYLW